MKTERTQTVAVLGTGAIGTAVARALARAGHAVHAWNRSGARTADAAAAGATVHASAREAALGADLVLVTVTDHDAVQAVLAALGPARDAATLAVLSTGTPEQATETAARVTGLGYAALDAGVQAAPETVGTPAATFLFAGDEAAFARHRAVLERLGTPRFVGTEPAAAAIWDLALFGVWYDAQLGLLRALDAVRAHGIDPRPFAETAAVQLGHAAAGATGTAQELADGTFPRGPADLREHLVVLDQLAALHGAGRLGDGGAAHVAELVRSAVAAGRGAEGLTAVVDR